MVGKFSSSLLAFVFAFFTAPVFAAIDVTAATTMITTDGGGAITLVGQALLGLAAIALVFRWVKAAFF
jgi:hypothetical protein